MSEATSDDNKQTSNDPDWGRFGLGTQQPPDGLVNKSYKDADADTDSDENELFVEEQVCWAPVCLLLLAIIFTS